MKAHKPEKKASTRKCIIIVSHGDIFSVFTETSLMAESMSNVPGAEYNCY